MNPAKRLFYILLTLLIVFIAGYFVYVATQMEPVDLGAAAETVGLP